MPNINLYLGACTGTEIDRNIPRINSTPQNTAIPFVWCVSDTLTGTAGSPAASSTSWNEPSGAVYQHFPKLSNCEVLDVQFSNPSLVSSVSISALGGGLLYTVNFSDSGTTDIFIYLVEGAVDPDNP